MRDQSAPVADELQPGEGEARHPQRLQRRKGRRQRRQHAEARSILRAGGRRQLQTSWM